MRIFIAAICVVALGCSSAGSGTVARDRAVRAPDSELRGAPNRLDLESAEPAAGGELSPLLAVLEDELHRSFTELKEKVEHPPYFLGYHVTNEREVDIGATFGALERSDDETRRNLDVEVRVGDRSRDNTHTIRGGGYDFGGYGRGSMPLSLEDDPLALRTALWLQTDRQWKAAVENLMKVRANTAVKVEEEDSSPDFSVEDPVRFVGKLVELQIDRPFWEGRVREYSALFKQHPEFECSGVSFNAVRSNRFVVNSEGTSTQTGTTRVSLRVSACVKAEDGMRMHRLERFEAESVEGLPSDDEIRQRIRELSTALLEVRNAPVAEPYAGPAILDGRAAAVFFHEIFGHRVEGHRQKDEAEGQTFAKMVGTQVMPPFMSVFDDPRIVRANGESLGGHYLFDDEGVRAQRAELVRDGVLTGFLMSRSPILGFAKSNGHGRKQSGRDAVARQANLVVSPARVVTPAELKQALLEEIEKQGKPYGLRFQEVEGGFTSTNRWGTQGFKVVPVSVSRVFPDGREEPVRGVDFVGTPLSTLSKIELAANDYSVFHGYCGAESGYVPVSAVSPSLLVSQIEVTRKQKSQERLPLLPPPPLGSSSTQPERAP